MNIKNTTGEEFTMFQSFIPMLDLQGTCVGVIISFRDMSAEARVHFHYKKMAAQEKRRANDLQRLVEERTHQLTVALEEVTRLSRVDPLTGLRVVRWNIIKNWTPKSRGFDIEAEMNQFVERQGYEIIESEIPYRERLGEKKLKLRDGFTIFKRIVTESLFS